MKKQCVVDGCESVVRCKGLCALHYQRKRVGLPMDYQRKKSCAVGGCARPVSAYGYCKFHWRRKRLGQSMDTPPGELRLRGDCGVAGCDKPHWAKGRCQFHYLRKRGGVSDTQRKQAVVSPDGARRVNFHGYVEVKRDGRWQLEHRWKMAAKLGRALLRIETVHHKNGDRLDNRLKNLELWTGSQPYGGRVKDKVAWAKEMLRRYEPSALK